jgi:hypothetical protein
VDYIYIWDVPGTSKVEVGSIRESSDARALERIRNVVKVKGGRLVEVHVSARKLILSV